MTPPLGELRSPMTPPFKGTTETTET
jgi:hypothetical protein